MSPLSDLGDWEANRTKKQAPHNLLNMVTCTLLYVLSFHLLWPRGSVGGKGFFFAIFRSNHTVGGDSANFSSAGLGNGWVRWDTM